ncbi:small subunit processome component 20 homolog, partial [Nilaparvata lugens]|uniref:small subunit processome component 20 homolog n=1 Tax=Nilaparvata lugens TaxID=108931 RepID=UPI00193CB797
DCCVVRDVNYYKLTGNQLKALLLYCEQDSTTTATGHRFLAAQAILGRKLICTELHDVMAKVAELSINSHLDHVRLQARQIIHQFLTTYQLGKKFGKHLNFYITNLDYNFQPGRESALELIHSLITTVPKEVLKKHYGVIFVPVTACLVNDDSPECRQKAAQVVTSLLDNLHHNAVDKLFDIVTLWMQEKQIGHRRLSVQVCGLFISFEKERFEKRLPALMETILDQFSGSFRDDSVGKYVRRKPACDVTDGAENEADDVSNMADHHLYQLLNMLVKIASFCPKFLKDPAYTQYVETISENAQKLLSHPHEWVRLAAAQFLSRVIAQLQPAEIAAIANGEREETAGYLRNSTRAQLKAFALDHCNQLIPGVELHDKFLMQCMKNLVFVGEVLKDVVNVEDEQLLSLSWLIRVMRKSIHVEIAKMPSSTVVRKMVFHWIAAIALKLDKEALQPILNHMLAPLVRELNVADDGGGSGGGSGGGNGGVDLRQIAKEAAVYVRRKIGAEDYNRLVANLTTRLDVRRAERKKERAQLAVTEPELAAKKKILKQQKKKEQKKRKIASFKGKKGIIKRRKKSVGDVEIT